MGLCEKPILFNSLVLEASTFSKKDYIEWVRGAIFSPMHGLKIEFGELEYGMYDLNSCGHCASKWRDSGIVELVKEVKWHLVKEKKDVMKLVRVCAERGRGRESHANTHIIIYTHYSNRIVDFGNWLMP